MACETQTLTFDNMQVAAPCDANWKDMSGDDRSRHCALCRKNVYNLSAMTRAEAEALIREKEGKLCVRFYQRTDGTVLTENCPVGLRAIRRRLIWIGSGVAAMLALGIAFIRPRVSTPGSFRSLPIVAKVENIQPFKAVIDAIDPVQIKVMMGKPAVRRVAPVPVQPPAPQVASQKQ